MNAFPLPANAINRFSFYGWLLLLLAASSAVFSAEILVHNQTEFNNAVSTVQPGDTITLAEGIWTNADLLFKTDGAPGDSIVLRAETPGRVLLNGTSRLRIAGKYLIVDGLLFKGGRRSSGSVIEFRENSGNLARHCRLTNTAIEDYNPVSINTDYKWVSLYGDSNRVDHCYFRNKRHSGTTLVVWLNGIPNYHRVDHNYFAYRPPLGFNGGETIRIGTSEWSLTDSYTLVEYNYFEQCNGENEIISNKSGENTFRYNTFFDCYGTLTLRHGNRAKVYGNFFFGNMNDTAGGVRIIGEDHQVYNNYFQDLYGSSFRTPISLMNGVPNSPANRYFQVKRAKIMFNTFVNCRNPVVIGLGKDDELTLPPEDCVIANNIIYTTNSSQIIYEEDTPINMQYEGNIMYGSPLGIPPNPGITSVDPMLVFAADSLWRPDTQSPAIGAAAGSYPQVSDDMDGQLRTAGFDIGADQLSNDPILRRPLFADDVGPDWFPLGNTVVQISPGQNTLIDAVNAAQPGDIITLLPGDYPNDSNIEVTIPLTIRATETTGDRPVIRQVDPSAGSRSIFVFRNGGSLHLFYLELDGMAGSATPAEYLIRTDENPMTSPYVLKADDCYLRDVVPGSGGNFFRAYPGTFADSIVFTNCLFNNSGGEGLRLNEEATGSGLFNVDWFEFTNCTFWNTAKEAITVYAGDQQPFSPGPRLRINHCTFDNCGFDNSRIIYARECDAAQIKNSLFTNSPDNTESVILEGLISSISYCDTFNVGPVVTNRSAAVGAGMVDLDPLYADRLNGDFHLPLNSPVLGLANDGKALGDLRWAPVVTGIGDNQPDGDVPASFTLFQNYPNPFNPTTVISYQLSVVSKVKLEIYNLLGEKIATLVDARQSGGGYQVQWNGRDEIGRRVSSGVYLYRLSAGSFVQTRKMIFLK